MPIVYDLDTSPNCRKTKILPYELGIPFEQRTVDQPTVQALGRIGTRGQPATAPSKATDAA